MNNSSKPTPGAKPERLKREDRNALPLMRNNFIMMTLCGVLIIAGFALMVGGGTADGTYDPAIFSTRRIVVGPTMAFLGFVGMGIAIAIKPRGKK